MPVIITMVLLALGANWIIQKANLIGDSTLPVIKTIPSFSLRTQDGNLFSESELNGKITVLDFMFTSCLGPCPLMTHNMRKLYNQYRSKPDVQFVSITVDPIRDTEEMLKQYALSNGVTDERWQFLTGEMDTIQSISQEGFLLFAESLPAGHAIKFVLIDHKGQIRKYYDGTDDTSMKTLQKDLDFFLKEINS